MTLEEFIRQADPDKFYESSPEERLRFAQEYENMMAELEHRDPYNVIAMPEEEVKEYPGVLGYCSDERRVLALNPKFLKSKKPKIPGVSSYGFADMIETLTHEGRHAWQHYVIEHPEKNLVDDNIRMALQMNLGPGYRSTRYTSFAEYAAQLVEIDARHFAMDWIHYLQKRFEEKDGIGINEFACTYKKLVSQETVNAQYIVEHLDAEKLKAFEENLKMKLFPGIDTSDVSMFADAIDLINTMDTLSFVDCRPIDTAIDIDIDVIDDTSIDDMADRVAIKRERLKVGKVKLF